MHQVPDTIKPVYVTGPSPLQFHELYTPREDASKPKMIFKGEKSFWRTRDRIEFSFYESRLCKTMIITSQNIDTQAAYRTIFLNLESLYFELESKARGDRVPLTKKKDRKLDETLLHKSASDYILARLNIGADPLPWPKFIDEATPSSESTATTEAPSSPPPSGEEPSLASSTEIQSPTERMCVFLKLAGDACSLEIERPTKLSLDSIDAKCIKLEPTVAITSQPPPPPSSSPDGLTAAPLGGPGATEPVVAAVTAPSDNSKALAVSVSDSSVKAVGKGKETSSSSSYKQMSKEAQQGSKAPSTSTTTVSNPNATKVKTPANAVKKSTKT
eukprot:gene28789-37792_t